MNVEHTVVFLGGGGGGAGGESDTTARKNDCVGEDMGEYNGRRE